MRPHTRLDDDEPDGVTTELTVTRVKAADPKNRIGTLFVNPGGGPVPRPVDRSAARPPDRNDLKEVVSVTRIGVILGSTRPNRNGEQVARWVFGIAAQRSDAAFELVDLRDFPLPPSAGRREDEGARRWAEKIASFDGFVIVIPEYIQRASDVLENAIEHPHPEWSNKAVGFVTYGGGGGARTVDHLRLVAGELRMADVRQQVALSVPAEFEAFPSARPWPGAPGVFTPAAHDLPALTTLLDEVIAWSAALAPLHHAPTR